MHVTQWNGWERSGSPWMGSCAGIENTIDNEPSAPVTIPAECRCHRHARIWARGMRIS